MNDTEEAVRHLFAAATEDIPPGVDLLRGLRRRHRARTVRVRVLLSASVAGAEAAAAAITLQRSRRRRRSPRSRRLPPGRRQQATGSMRRKE